MTIFLKNYFVTTTKETDFIPIIHDVRFAIRDSNIADGLVTISLPGAEAYLLICKEERYKDFKAPYNTSLSIPFKNKELLLHPKQMIYLVDVSALGKRREFHVQVMGEAAQTGRQQRPQARRQRR